MSPADQSDLESIFGDPQEFWKLDLGSSLLINSPDNFDDVGSWVYPLKPWASNQNLLWDEKKTYLRLQVKGFFYYTKRK